MCVRTYAREGIRGYCRCYLMDATHKDNAYKKQLWMNTKHKGTVIITGWKPI